MGVGRLPRLPCRVRALHEGAPGPVMDVTQVNAGPPLLPKLTFVTKMGSSAITADTISKNSSCTQAKQHMQVLDRRAERECKALCDLSGA